jgi:curli biogenesis system outer membrane secretion channel CsgG
MNRALLFILITAGLAWCAPTARADPAPPAPPDTNKAAKNDDLTVAILDFDASLSGNPDMGKQINDILTATLSGQDGFTLVDRTAMDRILQENAMTASGLVNPQQAAKIGKLVGARILVTGKIFLVDKQLYLTAKLIGTETSLVDGMLVNGDKDSDIGKLMMQLADKMTTHLRDNGPKLVARDDSLEDPLPGLDKALAGLALPTVAVQVTESHITPAPPVRIDPAAQTELTMILKNAGFKIVEGDSQALADGGVSQIISGEAFSEFAARIGTLVSCSARVELKITDRKTGEVLYSDRETARAVDLAENIAGKTALQKAAHLLGIRVLQHYQQALTVKAPGGK